MESTLSVSNGYTTPINNLGEKIKSSWQIARKEGLSTKYRFIPAKRKSKRNQQNISIKRISKINISKLILFFKINNEEQILSSDQFNVLSKRINQHNKFLNLHRYSRQQKHQITNVPNTKTNPKTPKILWSINSAKTLPSCPRKWAKSAASLQRLLSGMIWC